jgi:hypothetical protein
LREARAAGRVAVYKNDERRRRRRVSQQQALPSVSSGRCQAGPGALAFGVVRCRCGLGSLFPAGKRNGFYCSLFRLLHHPRIGGGSISRPHRAFRFLTVADATQEPAIRVGRACGDARVTHRWLRRPESVRHQPLVWWLYQHHAVCR